MLSARQFVIQSLELNLFFLRIMKEHSFFLGAGFTPKNQNLTQEAANFQAIFTELLSETLSLSNGVITEKVLNSGEIRSMYTLEAERATEFYTGANLNTDITIGEAELEPLEGCDDVEALEPLVVDLNNRILPALGGLINFKERLLQDIFSCNLFTNNYPLLIDHIKREAELYYRMLSRLQERVVVNLAREAVMQEAFWNRIMAEHAKFIRGLLDPTENALIRKANMFANQFDALTAESISVNDGIYNITQESLRATVNIRNFKSQGTAGLLNCEIRSIIVPLLADHTLREANHFLRLLRGFKKQLS